MTSKYIETLNRIFDKATIGKLKVVTPEGQELVFSGNNQGPSCDITIHDWTTLDMVKKRGDIGLGEAYHLGMWGSSDTADFLTYCSLNLDQINNAGDANFLNRIFFYFYNHFVRLNTKYGSKKNILEHYDIGNDFYQLWLDPSMTYSSAIRKNPEDSLEQAQLNKYDRIIEKLDLRGKKVLEIGCGWGGFADRASSLEADVTGITISDKQYEYAKKRLQDRAKILTQDYRDLQGQFDRIVSIEMFEAVGEKYWPKYFQQIKKLLVDGGRAIVQTITIADDAFAQYRKNSDYIRHHVFPGGMLPSRDIFCKEAAKAGLSVVEVFEFGSDYAWTLEQWRQEFNKKRQQLMDMRYSLPFLRSWEFYFCISIAGFKSQRTNVMQVELKN